MKKTWHIWILFCICLLGVAVAMSWLTLKTVRLDALREADRAETEMARREAELQERVSSALYRMDMKMLPLIAQEAARPPYMYQPYHNLDLNLVTMSVPPTSGKLPDEGVRTSWPFPSPLLSQSSDSVLLYFQIDANNHITSPQYPESQEQSVWFVEVQPSGSTLEQTRLNIERAKELFHYQALMEEMAADQRVEMVAQMGSVADLQPPLLAYNVPAVENFRNTLQTQAVDPATSNYENKVVAQQSRGNQRVNEEFNNRRDSTQALTQQNIAINSFAYSNGIGLGNGNYFAAENVQPIGTMELAPTVPMQPLWLGDSLILVRQLNNDVGNVFQCCWLNWEKIKADLQNEVAELLPNVQFEALTAQTELKIGTALTTIPVQLMVDRPAMLAMLALDFPVVAPKSVMPLSVLAAWGSLGLAAIASALLLHGVLRLSQRRAAFVSAVTHELRTPLTTFRMYSEMLADGMVPLEKQQQYANTLKVQADRLSHLVENVLQFARLERGPVRVVNETTTVRGLLDRLKSRLLERANDSQMQLEFEMDEQLEELSVSTQPATVEQILFNLVDNACKYARGSADPRIVVSVSKHGQCLRLSVRDFGPGIPHSDRKRMFQPFYQSEAAIDRAIPGVGLGLALCQRMARSLGGRLYSHTSPTGALFILELPSL